MVYVVLSALCFEKLLAGVPVGRLMLHTDGGQTQPASILGSGDTLHIDSDGVFKVADENLIL